jgi:hypothetical protein
VIFGLFVSRLNQISNLPLMPNLRLLLCLGPEKKQRRLVSRMHWIASNRRSTRGNDALRKRLRM